MSRRRRSRAARDAFGASLLDMMCCGLGAAIVVFVLRQLEIDRKVERAETAAEWMRNDAVVRISEAEDARDDADRMRGEAITELARAERQEREADRIGEDVRARQRASMFGLPPLRGNISVVLDRSGSMGWSNKLAVAMDCIDSVIADGMLIERLRMVSFAMGDGELGHRIHFDGDPGPGGTQQRKDTLERVLNGFRNSVSSGNGTDLPSALAKELAWIERVGGGTMLLVTDGISSGEIDETVRSIRDFRARNQGAQLVIHTINLVELRDGIGEFSRDAQNQPGFVLSVLAGETGGTVVSIPLNQPR